MSGKGLAGAGNVSGTFGASASSSSGAKGQSQSSATSGKSSASVKASYSYTSSKSTSSQSPSPAVHVSFNNNVEAFTPSQVRNTSFKHTVQNELALKNEKTQVLYSNQKNWEQNIRKKLVAKAFPEPTNDMMHIRNRNINSEYSDRLKAHQNAQHHIQVRFDQQITNVRASGETLSKNFEKPTHQKGYERPKIRRPKKAQTRDKGRAR